MKHFTFLQLFGDTYNCGTYGSGGYNENECATLVDGGSLSDTGTSVVVGIGGGILLVAIAVYLMLRNRKKK